MRDDLFDACCLLLSVVAAVVVGYLTFNYFGYGYGNSNSKILLLGLKNE